jgi:hypothetical protein
VAAELKTALDVDTELVVGGVGEFTVWLDGVKIAEKTAAGFPEPAEVVRLARAR